MDDATRLLSEAERSARAARHARTEGRCVECGAPYTPGTWIIVTDVGTVHRACFRKPDPIASKRRRPPKPATKFTARPLTRSAYVTAERSGRCPICGDRWQAGETIASTGTRLVCGACGASPVRTTIMPSPGWQSATVTAETRPITADDIERLLTHDCARHLIIRGGRTLCSFCGGTGTVHHVIHTERPT